MPRSSGTGSVAFHCGPMRCSVVHGVRWPNATDAPTSRTWRVGVQVPTTVTVACWCRVTVVGSTVTDGPLRPARAASRNASTPTAFHAGRWLCPPDDRHGHPVVARGGIGEELTPAVCGALEHDDDPPDRQEPERHFGAPVERHLRLRK